MYKIAERRYFKEMTVCNYNKGKKLRIKENLKYISWF